MSEQINLFSKAKVSNCGKYCDRECPHIIFHRELEDYEEKPFCTRSTEDEEPALKWVKDEDYTYRNKSCLLAEMAWYNSIWEYLSKNREPQDVIIGKYKGDE